MRIIALHSHAIAVVCRNVHIDEAVHAANARLLAAAPLMFELLCELRQVERWPAYDPSGTPSRVFMVVPERATRVRCGCGCPQYSKCPMHVSLTERALRLAVANGYPFCAHCVRQVQRLRARLRRHEHTSFL